MKNIERGTIKFLIVFTLMVMVFGLIIYPLFDFVLCKFITKSEFVYSIHNHVIQPIIFAVIYGLIYWAVDRKKK